MGDAPEAQQANRDSFHYSNISPQIDDFNESSLEGIWVRLENALHEDADVQDLWASVLAGLVIRPDDRVYRGVVLPSEYWKLLVFREQGVLKARVFLLTQDLDRLRAVLALDGFRVYQASVDELEKLTQFRFPRAVQQSGGPAIVRAASERKPLAAV